MHKKSQCAQLTHAHTHTPRQIITDWEYIPCSGRILTLSAGTAGWCWPVTCLLTITPHIRHSCAYTSSHAHTCITPTNTRAHTCTHTHTHTHTQYAMHAYAIPRTSMMPTLWVAYWVKIHSQLFGPQIPTRSPFCTPRANSPAANWSAYKLNINIEKLIVCAHESRFMNHMSANMSGHEPAHEQNEHSYEPNERSYEHSWELMSAHEPRFCG
jgi:hypothetical protein